MNERILNYDKIFYDCDGVILDSNKIKTEAFYKVALKYGSEKAEKFVKYHKENGGISRYKKIEHLLKIIVNDYTTESYDNSLLEFGSIVKQKLLVSKLVPGVRQFLEKYNSIDSYVVSGGSQQELENTFEEKNLKDFFKHIGGSPSTKYEIIDSIIARQKTGNYLFIGDSRLDYEVAKHYKMDFIFIFGVTEFKDWQNFFQNKDVMIFKDFDELMNI